MIDFAASGPYRIDDDALSDPYAWEIVDVNGELVCEAFHPDVAAHIVACLNERWQRDTASKAADAARHAKAPETCAHLYVLAPKGNLSGQCYHCGAMVDIKEAPDKETK